MLTSAVGDLLQLHLQRKHMYSRWLSEGLIRRRGPWEMEWLPVWEAVSLLLRRLTELDGIHP